MKVKITKIVIPTLLLGAVIGYGASKIGKINQNNIEVDNEIVSVSNIEEENTENKLIEDQIKDNEQESKEDKKEELVTEKEETKVEEKAIVETIETPTGNLQLETKKVVVPTTTVNVRSEANTECEKYGTIDTNSKLDLIYQENEDLYKVKYKDKEAYISTKYSNVEEQRTILSPVSKIAYITKDTKVYDYNIEDKELTSLPKLEAIPVYGEKDGYYLTYYNDKVGTVKTTDAEELNGTFVIVDISDQTAYLYEDNELIISTPVVTGKNSTPTTKGLHEVWCMEKDRYLTGADFKVHVDVVAFFHNGEGLHDANWRSAFGGNLYKNNGSHGCVNMPSEAAKAIYKHLEIGDKVLVKQ